MVLAGIQRQVKESLDSVIGYLELEKDILQFPDKFHVKIIKDGNSCANWTTISINPSNLSGTPGVLDEEVTHGLYDRFHYPVLQYYKIARLPFKEQAYLYAAKEFIAGLMRLIIIGGKPKLAILTQKTYNDKEVEFLSFEERLDEVGSLHQKVRDYGEIQSLERDFGDLWGNFIFQYGHSRGYRMAQAIYNSFREDDKQLRKIAMGLFAAHPQQVLEFGDALINGFVRLN